MLRESCGASEHGCGTVYGFSAHCGDGVTERHALVSSVGCGTYYGTCTFVAHELVLGEEVCVDECLRGLIVVDHVHTFRVLCGEQVGVFVVDTEAGAVFKHLIEHGIFRGELFEEFFWGELLLSVYQLADGDEGVGCIN